MKLSESQQRELFRRLVLALDAAGALAGALDDLPQDVRGRLAAAVAGEDVTAELRA